jgi:hypothetical protein
MSKPKNPRIDTSVLTQRIMEMVNEEFIEYLNTAGLDEESEEAYDKAYREYLVSLYITLDLPKTYK